MRNGISSGQQTRQGAINEMMTAVSEGEPSTSRVSLIVTHRNVTESSPGARVLRRGAQSQGPGALRTRLEDPLKREGYLTFWTDLRCANAGDPVARTRRVLLGLSAEHAPAACAPGPYASAAKPARWASLATGLRDFN